MIIDYFEFLCIQEPKPQLKKIKNEIYKVL